MQDFESYVKSNYTIPEATACGINYTYTTRTSTDRKSKTTIKHHIVTMKLIWFDKDSKQLATERLVFQDDTLTKASEKQCTTISPTEVTNKFMVAKQDIVRLLIKVKQNKINDLQHEANALYNYLGSSTDIIPQQMKGTLTIEPCIELQRVASKTTFDM
jgi:hypothetical protein